MLVRAQCTQSTLFYHDSERSQTYTSILQVAATEGVLSGFVTMVTHEPVFRPGVHYRITLATADVDTRMVVTS